MRLATVLHPDGATRSAVQAGSDWVLLDAPDVGALIAQPQWRETVAAAVSATSASRLSTEKTTLARPVLAPAKIICCGLNYRDHIVETGREVPQYPTLFAKFADTLTDPAAKIEVHGSEQVDWEAELAVVVGDTLHRATPEEAREQILGYTVANDISMRDWQSRTLQWLQGKAFDRTTPVGPVIVTADEIDPEQGLVIRTMIDDDIVQESNTRELVFTAPRLLAYISQFTALGPGDLILTGTPGGVGLGRSPKRFLRHGEVLTTSISGIGELRNTIVIGTGNRTEMEQEPTS